MILSGEHLNGPVPGSLQSFRGYSSAVKQRLDNVDYELELGLAMVLDPQIANVNFDQVGRPDLRLSQPAAMMSIDHPDEIPGKAGNFVTGFGLFTGHLLRGEKDWRNMPTEKMPASEAEIMALAAMPLANGYEEFRALQTGNEYPALWHGGLNHSRKPAFLRLLVLAPRLTTDLILKVSPNINKHPGTEFAAESFAAYQLMSRLVDTTDDGVTRTDGSVKDEYLLGV